MCIARKVGEAAENASKNMLLLTSNAIKLKQYLAQMYLSFDTSQVRLQMQT